MGILRMTKSEVSEISNMCIPVFIEQMAIALIPILITSMVKGAGSAAVAAVNMLNSLTQLYQQLFTAMGVGVTVVVAQYRGRGDLSATGHVAGQTIMLALYLAIATAGLSYLFMGPLLGFILGASEPAVYTFGSTYLQFNLLSVPFIAIYMVAAAAIRGSGHPRASLFNTLVHSIAYVVLSFGAIHFLHMDTMMAVGFGLLISRMLGALVALIQLRRGNENMSIKKIPLKLDMAVMRPVFLVGLPIFMEQLIFQVGRLFTQKYAIRYGTNGMAVNGIAFNFLTILNVTGMAMTNAAPPIVGRYIGERDHKGATRKGYQFILLGAIFIAVTCLVVLVFLVPLSKMMSDVPDVQSEVRFIVMTMCVMMITCWPPGFITPAVLRSSGDSKFASIVCILAMLLMRVGLSYLLTQVWTIGIIGMWLGMYADWIMRTLIFLPRLKSGKWLEFTLIKD